MNLLYVPLIGFPLCAILMMFGLMLCCTIIFLPFGLACFALALRVVVLPRRF